MPHDQPAPETEPTISGHATTPPTRWHPRPCLPCPPSHWTGPTARPRVRRDTAMATATPCSPHCLSTAIKAALGREQAPHHHRTPPLHLEATEEQPELNSEPHGHQVVPPRRSISGDASGAMTLPRPAAVDHHPRRSPSPPAGSLPGHSPSSLSLSVLRSVGRKRTAVRRRSVDQRPQLFPACFETSEEIAKSWTLLL